MTGWTAVLGQDHDVDLREYDVPSPGPGDALLEMVRANVCGSDVHILRGKHPLMRPGYCMGHEGVARVERLGSGVSRDAVGRPLTEGDRVTFTYLLSCGRCWACDAGLENFCTQGFDHWCSPADDGPHFKGTFASHYYVTGRQLIYKLPDSVTDVAAVSANCALTQMVNAVRRADARPGQTLLILGAGGLGLCGAAVAAETGARVVVADRLPGKAEVARRFGAHEVLDLSLAQSAEERQTMLRSAGLDGRGADAVIDVTGAAPAFLDGLAATRIGGRFLSVGTVMPSGTVEFDPATYTRTGVTIEAVIRYRPRLLGEAVAFLSRTTALPWGDLVDREFFGTDASAALAAAATGSGTRISLIMGR